MFSSPLPHWVIALLSLTATAAFAAGPPLIAGQPIVVPDSTGGFDFLEVDAAQHRLLADHTGNNTLDVFDLDSGELIKHIPTGKAQGVAVDPVVGKYFVSVSREKVLVIIDAKTLTKTGEVKLPGEADAIAFNPKNHCVYVDHDDTPDAWVIDTHTEKLIATIKLSGEPECVLYDTGSDRVYQNIKTSHSVCLIDPATNTITHEWPVAPATSPHGIALNEKTRRLYSVGANGKLTVLNADTGKVITVVDVADGVDQIAFDTELKRVYCPSIRGLLTVVQETADGAVSLGDIKTAPGAKTLAVDPKTHAVWVAYAGADKKQSYILRLTTK